MAHLGRDSILLEERQSLFDSLPFKPQTKINIHKYQFQVPLGRLRRAEAHDAVIEAMTEIVPDEIDLQPGEVMINEAHAI